MGFNADDLLVARKVGTKQIGKFSIGQLENHLKGRFIEKTGGSMTGPLQVFYPDKDDEITPKDYIDIEIGKLRNELEDSITSHTSGMYGYSDDPSNPTGTFQLIQGGTNYNPSWENADQIVINKTNTNGEIFDFNQLKEGFRLKLTRAGSSDAAMYIIDSVTPGTDRTTFGVTLVKNRGSASPSVGDYFYVNDLEVGDLAVIELEKLLDSVYVKERGDEVEYIDVKYSTPAGGTNVLTTDWSLHSELDPFITLSGSGHLFHVQNIRDGEVKIMHAVVIDAVTHKYLDRYIFVPGDDIIVYTQTGEATSLFKGSTGNWDFGPETETDEITTMRSMFQNCPKFNSSLSLFKTGKVLNMDYMFEDAAMFTQNISDWCVDKIPSKPFKFDTDSGFDGQTAIQPQWGTCP